MKNLLIPFIALLLFSCDKIDNTIPIPSEVPDDFNYTDSLSVISDPMIKKIMIEEFTGHLCKSCPDGARKIEQLHTIFGDQIIPVSIHAGAFSDPISSTDFNGDGVFDYTTDFQTTEGNEYSTTFGVSSYPAATISRLNNATITGLNQWESVINTIKNDPPKLNLTLTNLYDASNRTIKSIVKTEWLATETGNFKLQMYLVEDNVIDWQLDGSTHLQFYTHRHVFRTAMNGTWGTPIPSSDTGDTDSQEYYFTIPSEWDEKQCSIIAFVYESGPEYEIYQAEELYVKHP